MAANAGSRYQPVGEKKRATRPFSVLAKAYTKPKTDLSQRRITELNRKQISKNKIKNDRIFTTFSNRSILSFFWRQRKRTAKSHLFQSFSAAAAGSGGPTGVVDFAILCNKIRRRRWRKEVAWLGLDWIWSGWCRPSNKEEGKSVAFAARGRKRGDGEEEGRARLLLIKMICLY